MILLLSVFKRTSLLLWDMDMNSQLIWLQKANKSDLIEFSLVQYNLYPHNILGRPSAQVCIHQPLNSQGKTTSTQTSHDSFSATVTTNYIWLYIRSKFNVTVYINLPPEFESLGIMLILLSHRPSYNIVHVYSIKRYICHVSMTSAIYFLID